MSTPKIEMALGHGSGVHIGNGIILTAAHVVKGNDTVTIKLYNKKEYKARPIFLDEERDIALVQIIDYTEPFEHLQLSCNYKEQHGDIVRIIGNPGMFEFIITSGKIAGLFQQNVIPIDATIMPGNSGGPAVNSNNEIIGIVIKVVAFRGMIIPIGLMVPSYVVCDIINTL